MSGAFLTRLRWVITKNATQPLVLRPILHTCLGHEQHWKAIISGVKTCALEVIMTLRPGSIRTFWNRAIQLVDHLLVIIRLRRDETIHVLIHHSKSLGHQQETRYLRTVELWPRRWVELLEARPACDHSGGSSLYKSLKILQWVIGSTVTVRSTVLMIMHGIEPKGGKESCKGALYELLDITCWMEEDAIISKWMRVSERYASETGQHHPMQNWIALVYGLAFVLCFCHPLNNMESWWENASEQKHFLDQLKKPVDETAIPMMADSVGARLRYAPEAQQCLPA